MSAVVVPPAVTRMRLAVLVAELLLAKVKMEETVEEELLILMVVVARDAVEEAWRFPDICNGPATVEEPVEIYPPPKLARPLA